MELLGIEKKSMWKLDFELPTEYRVHCTKLLPNERMVAFENVTVPEYEQTATNSRVFKLHLASMQGIKTWDALVAVVRRISIRPLTPPGEYRRVLLNWDPEDLQSRPFIPLERVNLVNPFAIRTAPDGSCFCHAASRLAFGNQNHAAEMRVRLIIEMVTNIHELLSHAYLKRGLENHQMQETEDLVADLLE